jgi:hypothetical protein
LADRELDAGLVGSRFIDRPLGIAFTVPTGWIIRELREVLETAAGRMINEYDDAFNEALQSIAADHLPLVAISAPTWDHPIARLGHHEIAPIIALSRTQPEEARTPTFDLWNWVMDDLALFHANLEDYRLIRAPQPTILSDLPAVTYACAYSQRHMDAVEALPVREETFYWRQAGGILELRLCDYPTRHSRLTHDFSGFSSGVILRHDPDPTVA